MEIKRIQCPSCGVILDVRNSKDEDIKIITCPQCKATLRVRFHKHQEANEPLDAKTFLADQRKFLGDDTNMDGNTRLPQFPIKSKKAFLIVGGKEYQLSIGLNTIGRKSPTSSATVQIPSEDGYMSRRHAKIAVSITKTGLLKSVISNDKNKNPTMVEGQEIMQEDEIILTNGNEIVMGKTKLTYLER